MNAEQIAEIKARADAATPGPWERGFVWLTAGVTWSDSGENVGPKEGTRCAYCHLGEPAWTGRADINGTRMPAHHHRSPEPYDADHQISGPPGMGVTGNYDYEVGGILSPEDTEFIAHARTDVPDLLAEVARLTKDRDHWHDTYQQDASAHDEFLTELLEILPGDHADMLDAYAEVPNGIERLKAEVARLTADRDRQATAVGRAPTGLPPHGGDPEC